MHRQKNKRRKQLQLAFVYTLMVVSVLSIVTVLVLVIQGYRYNRYDGKVEQGGLVQFDSRPSGATVLLDDVQLANRTASRLTVSSGDHVVTMTRDGYSTWKKTVTVKPGAVLWLNYTRLFPTSPVVTTAASFASVSGALASPDRKELAVVQKAATPRVTLVKLDGDTPKVTQFTLDSTKLSGTDEDTQKYSLESWSANSRYLLIRHDYGKKSEYLSLDTTGGDGLRNITVSLGVEVAQIAYKVDDPNIVYILTSDHEIRTGNLSARTLSGPIAQNVSELNASDRFVTYTTRPDNGMRSIGYISPGAGTGKLVETLELSDKQELHFAIGQYYGDNYAVVAADKEVGIHTISLPASDSSAASTLKQLTKFTLESGPTYVGYSPVDERMVYVQNDDVVKTYDLELGTLSSLKFPTMPSGRLAWMDGFHVMNTAGGDFYYYDFDGTNSQLVATGVVDMPTVLAQGDKYLYYFAGDDEGYRLERVQMLPN